MKITIYRNVQIEFDQYVMEFHYKLTQLVWKLLHIKQWLHFFSFFLSDFFKHDFKIKFFNILNSEKISLKDHSIYSTIVDTFFELFLKKNLKVNYSCVEQAIIYYPFQYRYNYYCSISFQALILFSHFSIMTRKKNIFLR